MTGSLMSPLVTKGALILASGSTTRAEILRNAGLDFSIKRPDIDEGAVRHDMLKAGASVEAGALRLAELKARQISGRHPAALVVGADQILECGGQWFEKPAGRDQARAQLRQLSGKTHRLISAVTVSRGGEAVWHHVDQARLWIRPLGAEFLEHYLDALGNRAFDSVGGYQIEGLGAQLFERIEGDHFTILGLPLRPTLAFLRDNGILES